MGMNDHIDMENIVEQYKTKCIKCGREYLQTRTISEDSCEGRDVCPYCGNLNWASSAYEFKNERIEK